MARVDRHDAGIAEPDAALRRGRVLGLDDRLEHAVVAADEPAIGAGIGRPHAEHDDGRRPARAGAPRAVPRASPSSASGVSPKSTSTSSMRSPAMRSASAGQRGSAAWPVPSGCGLDRRPVVPAPPSCATALHAGRQHDDGARRRQRRQPRRARGGSAAGRPRGAAPWAARISCACPCRRQGRSRRTRAELMMC